MVGMEPSFSILNALSLPAFVIDTQHRIVLWNASCELLTGVPAAEVVGTRDSWRGFYDKPRPCLADLVLDNLVDDASRFYHVHEKTEFAEDGHQAEDWFHLNGKRRYLTFEARPIFLAGKLIGAFEILQDITRHKEADDKLKLAASVFANTSEGIMITGPDNRILSANHSLEGLTGYAAMEMVGRNPKLFASERHPASFFRAMWETLVKIGHWQGEFWNKRKTGEEYLVRAFISAVKTDEDVTNYIGLLTDITESNRVLEKMDFLAHHDFLTGLPNRSLLEDRMRQAMARAARNRSKLAVLFLDLDKFKAVNDTLGHDVGDLLLKEVTQRVQGCLRAADTISRQGGDEFVILLEDVKDESDVTHIARKLRTAVAKPYRLANQNLNVTCSIGISLFPNDGESVADLLKHADVAMYDAKNHGRNDFQFYTERMNAEALETMAVESALRQAIPGGLRLHFQPQLCLVTKSVHGAEALVRWEHSELGSIGPARFIPIAEEAGLICDIGDWVLREACQVMKATGINMSVNLSPLQLSQDNIVERVAEALDGMAGYRLTLEVTESAFINDFEKTRKRLLALKRIGVNLALDDFGTGYSSLSYLYQLPFDYLKIDQSFIRNAKNAPIVLAILDMSSKLNLLTVAEGVETPEQVAMLEGNGCDVVQGYYFSKPLPLAELKRFAQHPPYQVSPEPLTKRRPARECRPSIGWSFTFESGHPEIDSQHMELVRILNYIGGTVVSGGLATDVRPILKVFIDSVRKHFSFEEELMNRHGYPEVKRHHDVHLSLIETLSSYDLQLKRNAKLDLAKLVESLSTWLIEHILHSDKKLGRFLVVAQAGDS